ncbi:hypothetical protein [Methylopila sp. Yamaguchi]|uniref:hypothetical protein n=1 Tax=Methylopila sp. Yamaguchi TaxID=1437817 RepID=UPI000CB1993D|nr:hypothetical protein [Methylopila sp. Yamaguchi]GBD48109.1 hypothetical protein METY_1322 [Methylopila sp. Yamaguchi]
MMGEVRDWTDGVDEVQKATQSVGSAVAGTAAMAADAKAEAKAAASATPRIDYGVSSVTFNTVVSVSLAARSLNVAVPAAKVADRVLLWPEGAVPAGYVIISTARVTTAGQVPVQILFPAIVAISSVTLSFRMIAFRD